MSFAPHEFRSTVVLQTGIVVALLCFAHSAIAAERVTYMILAETVEPIMIVRDGDPMAGGIMTEAVKLIFADSEYQLEPRVLPWQRMEQEFGERDDWIVHGFPESFGSNAEIEFSELPIFPFNHSAVTLKGSGLDIRSLDDLDGQTLILVENFQYPRLDDFISAVRRGERPGAIGVLHAFTPGGSLEMLRHGRGDVVIDWQARIIFNLAAAGLNYDDVDFHDARNIVPTENIHLVFSANQSDDFRRFVNDRIKTLTESGQLQQLVEKYYLPTSPPDF